MTRILLVDDQQLLRRGLRLLLETEDGLEAAAEAADGHEALAVLRGTEVDVVLTDARMPGMDGVELVRQLAVLHPGLPAVVLTTFDDEDIITGAMAAGAAGFLLKDVSTTRLAEAIGEVASGGLVIDPRGWPGWPWAEAPSATIRWPYSPAPSGWWPSWWPRDDQWGDRPRDAPVRGDRENHVSALLRKLEQRDRTGLALTLYRLLHG